MQRNKIHLEEPQGGGLFESELLYLMCEWKFYSYVFEQTNKGSKTGTEV